MVPGGVLGVVEVVGVVDPPISGLVGGYCKDPCLVFCEVPVDVLIWTCGVVPDGFSLYPLGRSRCRSLYEACR